MGRKCCVPFCRSMSHTMEHLSIIYHNIQRKGKDMSQALPSRGRTLQTKKYSPLRTSLAYRMWKIESKVKVKNVPHHRNRTFLKAFFQISFPHYNLTQELLLVYFYSSIRSLQEDDKPNNSKKLMKKVLKTFLIISKHAAESY